MNLPILATTHCYSPLYIDHLDHTKNSIIAFLDFYLTNLVDSYFKTVHFGMIDLGVSLKTALLLNQVNGFLRRTNSKSSVTFSLLYIACKGQVIALGRTVKCHIAT